MMASTDGEMNLFRPPLVKASTTLNRALFAKTVPVAAARLSKPQDIGRYRKILEKSKDILEVERLSPVVADPDQTLASQGRRCLLLRPGIKAEGVNMLQPQLLFFIQTNDNHSTRNMGLCSQRRCSK
jgi:tRNA (guanine37-N1)-methyltransferase